MAEIRKDDIPVELFTPADVDKASQEHIAREHSSAMHDGWIRLRKNTPMTRLINAAARPMSSEMRVPYQMRTHWSRPNKSVPKGCSHDGLCSLAL